MAQFAWVGVDVGANQSQVCVTDDHGELLGEAMLPTLASDLVRFVTGIVPDRSFLIGIESGTIAIPPARDLRKLGCEVKIFDAFQTSRFLGIRQQKTDRNDARGIAEVARLGRAVSIVHLRAEETQTIRSQLVIRQNVVAQRLAMENVLRAVLRIHGGAPLPWWSASGIRRVVTSELARMCGLGVALDEEVVPLLDLCVASRKYVVAADRRLGKLAESIEVCRRWLDIPGVGPITALAFYSGIDDPMRFTDLASIGPYLGLAPRVRQTGNTIRIGRVTKRGDRLVRTQLVLAAGSAMRVKTDTELKTWALKVKERRGYHRARTALARKLATVMLAMWKSGESFRLTRPQTYFGA
jgi:transposase